ncbi:hypothetical protein ACQP2U_43135 (plasmid) [Nocardia sp. CA-084685]|uniref:hypothetical protein n=1 Tax=Nocardia sp. CA-084685 TaxID=3239970 RepID=UPI003D95C667
MGKQIRQEWKQVRKDISREWQLYQWSLSVERAALRVHIESLIRQFKDRVRQQQIDERDEQHLNASVDAAQALDGPGAQAPDGDHASQPLHKPQPGPLPGFLVEEQEAIAAQIDAANGLTDSERSRARWMLLHPSSDFPVFLPDRRLAMDVLGFEIDQLRERMTARWGQIRSAAFGSPRASARPSTQSTENVAAAPRKQHSLREQQPEHEQPDITGGREREGRANTSAAMNADVDPREARLIEWMGTLPELVSSNCDLSSIHRDLSALVDQVPGELGDRAQVITTGFIRDTRPGQLGVGYDPQQLMLVDDEQFRRWERRHDEDAASVVSSAVDESGVDEGLAAASILNNPDSAHTPAGSATPAADPEPVAAMGVVEAEGLVASVA